MAKTILRQVLDMRSVKVYLNFGITENVVFQKVDPNVVVKSDGTISSKHCVMTFSTIDENKNVKASSTVDFFNLDPSSEYVMSNLADEIDTFITILSLYMTPDEAVAKFSVLEDMYSDISDLEADLKNTKKAREIQDTIAGKFAEIVTPFIGLDSPKLRIKMVTEKTGKYLQKPASGAFLEPMTIAKEDSNLKITMKELKMSKAASTPQVSKPEKTGEAPAGSASDLLDEL